MLMYTSHFALEACISLAVHVLLRCRCSADLCYLVEKCYRTTLNLNYRTKSHISIGSSNRQKTLLADEDSAHACVRAKIPI